MTNNEYVGKALDLVLMGLGPFVEREVAAANPDAAGRPAPDAAREAWRYWKDRRFTSEPIAEWDVYALLKLVLAAWEAVFRKTLGNAERNYVSELLDARNRWAHRKVNDPFRTGDAHRVLDSAHRLLVSVSAPEAAEAERMKTDLLHQLVEEKNEKKPAGTYQMQATVTFLHHSQILPEPDRHKLPDIYSQLETSPYEGSGIRKLQRRNGSRFELRIGYVRVIYRVEGAPSIPAVTLLRIENVNHSDRIIRIVDRDESALPPVAAPQVESERRKEPDPRTADAGTDLPGSTGDDGPVRVIPSGDALREAADGSRPLASFLLVLDENQERLVGRFDRSPRPQGPWIVKGGPGSGKSTVALYCIQKLIRPTQHTLGGGVDQAPRILFTTYTKALTKVSDDLLQALGVDTLGSVEVTNVDALANQLAAKKLTTVYEHREQAWTDVVGECQQWIAGLRFRHDLRFLYREVNNIIVGRGFDSCEKYKGWSRPRELGAISPNDRHALWQFANGVRDALENRGRRLPAQMFRDIADDASPEYDYVFVDEAQDLLPIALRMCVRLARDARNVFLTADRCQSIYRSGFSWSEAEESLKFRGRGRSTILKHGHRSTREIMDAIRPILADDARTDCDTRNMEVARNGYPPELCWCSRGDDVQVVSKWLQQMIGEESLGLGHTAVLCPTNSDCWKMARELPRGMKAKVMSGRDMDLNHTGVSIMTMNSAKGLQFPIVALVGLEDGRMPWTNAPRTEIDKQRRLFFVACTRAMRRLLVVADSVRPSSFLAAIDERLWRVVT